MNIDVRIKAVTLVLGVAYLVTPFRAIVHADTKIGSGSSTNSFFGPGSVILTTGNTNSRKVSPHDHGNDHGHDDHGHPGGDHGGNNGHGSDHGGHAGLRSCGVLREERDRRRQKPCPEFCP